ncbi:MAG: dynamin family protein [Muribaculaceae bacterium]|nr:dynamin family protein [Muribaculaceae bacterium]
MNIAALVKFINKLDSDYSNSKGENRKKAIAGVKKRLQTLLEAMEAQANDNNQLIIAIVGQMKAGKSALLNALLFEGIQVLPTASTPMTAGLSIIQYVDNPNDQRFEVEYYTKKEWENIKGEYNLTNNSLHEIKLKHPELNGKALINKFKECCENENFDYQFSIACYELYTKMLEHPECGQKIGQPNDTERFTDLSEVAGTLIEYVGSLGKYAPVVKAVYLYVNSPLLTYKNDSTGLIESYKIVDTPGINDPVESRDRVAKSFLREAHAAIMTTRSDRSQTQSDISFINGHIIKGGMSKILFTFNKLDLVFEVEASDGTLPDDFSAAMADYVGYEDGVYKEMGELYNTFNQKIKPQLTNGNGILWTYACPYAEHIRFKLDKAGGNVNAAHLLDEEDATLKQLQEWFPEDFSEDNPELSVNLRLLGGFQRLKEDFLLSEFLRNKDSIVAKRYEDQNSMLREEVLNQFDTEIKEINDNQALLDSVDLPGLRSQIGILKNLKDLGRHDLYDCVNIFMNRLRTFVIKNLFADKLLPYKLTLNSNATDYNEVSYKRKGTYTGWFGGGIKNEKVFVNRVQPESVVTSHHQQIDTLYGQLKRLWKEQFLKERDALVKSLLQCIQTIANKDNTIGIDASIYTKALENVIDKVLIGREILNIASWIDKQKIELDVYARKNEHTSITTNYSETRLSTDEAQKKIEQESNEKVSLFKYGMNTRYIDFYEGLKDKILKENEDLNSSLQSFVEDVATKLMEVINNFIVEKEKLVGDRENAEKERNQLIKDLRNLKGEFEKL